VRLRLGVRHFWQQQGVGAASGESEEREDWKKKTSQASEYASF
jgi:hypothetical protein